MVGQLSELAGQLSELPLVCRLSEPADGMPLPFFRSKVD